uniref:Reverse transcriptase Ty1/copia-type domain-containing protein n=1 Tax=Anguilla anguilla TaxID=7936 RepID=A0A0E9UCG8_ANGAN
MCKITIFDLHQIVIRYENHCIVLHYIDDMTTTQSMHSNKEIRHEIMEHYGY